MKKIVLALALMLMTIHSFAQDSRSIYNKYSDEKGVSAVYISPAMFKMIGRIPEVQLNENKTDLTPLVKSLNGFYLLNSESTRVSTGINQEVKKFITSGKYELMMEVKDDGEAVRIYTVGNKKTITSLVLLTFDGTECTFIAMDGEMDRERLEELIADSM